jgi:hypothetical protein
MGCFGFCTAETFPDVQFNNWHPYGATEDRAIGPVQLASQLRNAFKRL